MSKKTYDVSSRRVGSYSTQKKDSSFASFVCILLVVLAICILLLILSSFYRKTDHKKEYKNKGKSYERLTHGRTTTESNKEFTDHNKEEINDEDIETTGKISKTTNSILDVKETTLELLTTTTSTSLPNESTIPPIMRETHDEMSTSDTTGTTDSVSKSSEKQTSPNSITDTTAGTTVSTSSVEDGNHHPKEDITTDETVATETQQTESTQQITSTNTTPLMQDTEENTSESMTEATTPFVPSTTHEQDRTDDEETTNISETTMFSSVKSSTEHYLGKETTTSNEVLSTISQEAFQTTEVTEHPTTLRPFNESDYVDTDLDNATESSRYSTTATKTKESYEDFNTLNFKDKDTCQSKSCNSMAARIISSMDTSRAPCEDFYNYACGGILVDENEEMDFLKIMETLDYKAYPFLEDFRNFYLSCERNEDRFDYEERIEALFHILNREIYGQGDPENRINELLANLMLLDAFPYLKLGIGIHPSNSSSFILELKKPKYQALRTKYWSSFSENQRKCTRKGNEGLNASVLLAKNLYPPYFKCILNRTDYMASMKNLREDRNLRIGENRTHEEVQKSLDVLRERLSLLDEFSISEPPVKEISTISDLQKRYPAFNWKSFLSFLLNEDLNEATEISIDDIKLLMFAIEKIDKRDLLNVLESFAEYIIYENIVIQYHVESRTEFCEKQAKYLMPDIANYLHKLTSDAKINKQTENIREFFDRFKRQFGKSLENSEWIDRDSKTQMLGKLNRIKLSIFSEEDYEEEIDALRIKYNGSVKRDDYPQNLVYLMKLKNRHLASLQGKEITSAKIHLHLMDAAGKNPFYINTKEIAYVPYGLVKQASKDLPGYLVMAQAGFPLAKIIGEAFSPSRISTEIAMNKKTREQFQQFVKQMNNEGTFRKPFEFNHKKLFFQESVDAYVDDMVAENTALRLLTDSLETFGNQSLLPWISYQFSREKIFFLGLTQEFCQKSNVMDVTMETYQNKILPPPLRTENILMNSEEFSKHFSCDENSRMYVSEKLQFPHVEMNFDMNLLN